MLKATHCNEKALLQRDQTLDKAKGIGILLMVIGHSGVPFVEFIYLFHMALFFMASGYVWNDKKVSDLPTLGKSLLARVRGLWLPYVIANGSFTLLNNVFVAVGIYGPEKQLGIGEIAKNLGKNLCFAGDTSLGGASWFLRTLFFISVAHLLIRYVVTKVKYGNVIFAAAVVLTLVAAEVINRKRWLLPMGIHSCFGGYTAFLLGMLLRKYDVMTKLKKYRTWLMLGGFAVLLALYPFDTIGPAIGNIGSLPFYIAASLAGWFMVWYLASFLRGGVEKLLCFCGRNSIWVVLLHFLAFKPVAYVYLLVSGGSMLRLSESPVCYAPGLWVAYSIAGAALPLLVCAGVRKLRKFRK